MKDKICKRKSQTWLHSCLLVVYVPAVCEEARHKHQIKLQNTPAEAEKEILHEPCVQGKNFPRRSAEAHHCLLAIRGDEATEQRRQSFMKAIKNGSRSVAAYGPAGQGVYCCFGSLAVRAGHFRYFEFFQ